MTAGRSGFDASMCSPKGCQSRFGSTCTSNKFRHKSCHVMNICFDKQQLSPNIGWSVTPGVVILRSMRLGG